VRVQHTHAGSGAMPDSGQAVQLSKAIQTTSLIRLHWADPDSAGSASARVVCSWRPAGAWQAAWHRLKCNRPTKRSLPRPFLEAAAEKVALLSPLFLTGLGGITAPSAIFPRPACGPTADLKEWLLSLTTTLAFDCWGMWEETDRSSIGVAASIACPLHWPAQAKYPAEQTFQTCRSYCYSAFVTSPTVSPSAISTMLARLLASLSHTIYCTP